MSHVNFGQEDSGSVGLKEPAMNLEKVLYTAKLHTTGGRDGASRSSDGRLDIKLPDEQYQRGLHALYGSVQ